MYYKVQRDSEGTCIVSSGLQQPPLVIAMMNPFSDADTQHRRATELAAAPRMHKALIDVVELLSKTNTSYFDEVLQKVRDAISSATIGVPT